MRVDYITGNTPRALVTKVQRCLDEKWKIEGRAFYANGEFIQTVVLPEPGKKRIRPAGLK